MKTLNLPGSVTRTFHKVGFQLKKHSPEILMVTGIVGGVTSAVMACKATGKAHDIIDEAKETITAIHTVAEKPENADKYTPEDTNKALTITYAKTGLELVKVYAPAITLGVVSVGCILASNNIMRKRNLALAAAYTAVDNSFKGYRNRVIERFGKELDRELKYNIKTKEIEETIINEDGTKSTVKKTVQELDNPNQFNEYSEFSRIYDDGCKGWDKDPEYSKTFLINAQRFANDKLQAQGYLYLNDVYDMLGFQRTYAGHVVGWLYDPSNPNVDSHVDFGIFDIHNPKARDFVNGYERAIILDFNVDGNVYEMMRGRDGL